MSLYAFAIRVLGRIRRRLKRARARRMARRFAVDCRAAGQQPGAVLLLERLGDFVAASAVVTLVRESNPDLRLCWFGMERYRELGARLPGIDAYVAIDCYGELSDVLAALGGWQVFDLNLNGKSCVCCGGAWRNLSGNDELDIVNYFDAGPLAAAFATVAGLSWRPTAPQLAAPVLAPAPRPRLVAPYAVVHSESEESAKNWNQAGWRELVDHLLAHTDLEVVHVGVRAAGWLPADPRVHELAGATTIPELMAITAACALFVGIDSSVAHIANAYGRPGLVLQGRYRKFTRYLPYTGHYEPAAGGAFVVRYPSESPFLPFDVVERALVTVCRRLRAGTSGSVRVGAGGPWDVRMHEVADPAARERARQDAVCDRSVVLTVDGHEEEWLRRWPGHVADLVLAITAARFSALSAAHGSAAAVLEWLEGSGARFALHRESPEEPPLPAAILASFRYLRRDGCPVTFGPGGDAPALLAPDVGPLDPATATDCRWFGSDLRGLDPRTGGERLRAAHEWLVAERADGPDLPDVGLEVTIGPDVARCGIDEVRRTPDGGLAMVSGWLFLTSTGTPPAFVCLGVPVGGERFVVRHTAPFSRLERPDVAAAFDAPEALFSGLRLEVPAALAAAGRELAVLVPDRRTGTWQRIELP